MRYITTELDAWKAELKRMLAKPQEEVDRDKANRLIADIERAELMSREDVYVEEASNPLAWIGDFIVTPQEAAEFANPDFLIDGLIVQGHLHIVAAEPNGGKSTIFFHLAGEIAKRGKSVIYVNADIGAGDSKIMVDSAKNMNVQLLLPDMKAGKSMLDVVSHLRELNDSGSDLSNQVWIFDTLKKMADVISKSSTKQTLNILRGLTAKGATIICLAHTNKYPGADGKPVYEGTGDIRSDVDNLVYLIPEKHTDGRMTVSVEPDKVRAALSQMTFEITPDRRVFLLDEYRDISEEKRIAAQRSKDQPVIERITECLTGKRLKQCDIIEYCKAHGISSRQSQPVLRRYADGEFPLWKAIGGFQNNAIYYELL